MHIVILEDDAGRRAAMADCLADRFPQYPVLFFVTAAETVSHLRRNLSETLAIGLDHDLDLVPVANGRLLDSGTGRDVADYLASEPPACPVVIATTNERAGLGMETTLSESGWPAVRVVPYGDLEWVPEVWFPTMRNAIVGEAIRSSPPRVSTAVVT